MDKIIIVDAQRCLGCHSCEIACAVAHSASKDLVRAVYEQTRPHPRIILERMEKETLPIHCRHCEDAPCVAVCPAQAVSRPAAGSPVTLDPKRCIGCHACIIVCPFGVIQRGPDGRSLTKCDLCQERLADGRQPACAEACPTGSIRYRSIEEFTSGKRQEYYRKFRASLQAGEKL